MVTEHSLANDIRVKNASHLSLYPTYCSDSETLKQGRPLKQQTLQIIEVGR